MVEFAPERVLFILSFSANNAYYVMNYAIGISGF